MSIKEYVMDEKEFKILSSGRVHHAIRKISMVLDTPKNGKVVTGEFQLILSVSAIAKDGHVLILETNYGIIHPKDPKYEERVQQIQEVIRKEFPMSTPGAWSHA